MEYALHLRELEEVAEALVEIEEDRRTEVHGANVRREQYNEREKEIQSLEKSIADARHALETVAQSRRDTQFEVTDFIRTRTELECIIEDLRAAGQNVGGKREDFEAELKQIEEKVAEKEALLEELLPEWEEQRALETTEKRRLDEASANLNSLFAKQGRVTKFRTKSERDAFLRHEIVSVSAYKANQVSALEVTRGELDTGKQSQNEIDTLIQSVHGKIEDGRQKAKEISENLAGLKEEHTKLRKCSRNQYRPVGDG